MTSDLRFSALKKTPFHSRTSLASRTNKWYAWNGFTVPTEYSTVELEYTAARNGHFELLYIRALLLSILWEQ